MDGDDCSFRILGPVQVVASGGPLRFTRRQQLDLVAFLLLHVDRVVTMGQIVNAMWGEDPPPKASVQIKNLLSALRGALHDATGPLATVDRWPAGYQLHITAGHLDLAVFTARVAQARAAQSPSEKVRPLRQALGLWQGAVPLAGVRAAFADAARTHLREQRDTALEELFDAELDCANHAVIVAALTDAVAENPSRERLVAQLMTALHRSGRTTDALDVYRRARRTLADEFGLEPGPALRELERRILLGDPTLDQPVPPVDVAVPSPVPVVRPMPAQLPLDVRGFVGRGEELAALDALVPDERTRVVVVAALMGTAGVGKTALAVHWAHRVADRFPDGQLYVNLRGFHPDAPAMTPAEAIRGFLDAFAVPPEQIPVSLDAQAALYRSIVAGRRVLVLLDNALDTEQVRPLLPGTPGCLVVVTSRSTLSDLVAAEGAHPFTLDVFTDNGARDFLIERLGADRVAAEMGAVQDIAAQCARLPLALAVVASRAAIHPQFPLATLSTQLSAARHELGVAGGDDLRDVRTAFSWSYQRLEPVSAGLFRLLGLHPGPDVAADAAASLVGVPGCRVRPHLAELVRAHLITEHIRGRYAVHDLLRAYAGELAQHLDTEEIRRLAIRRMLDYYLRSAYAAATLMYPHRYRLDLVRTESTIEEPVEFADADHALVWFAREHAVLMAAVDLAAAQGLGVHCWQLASAFATFLVRRGHWHDWAATQRTALAAAERIGDKVGLAHANGSLGMALNRLKRYEAAHAHLSRSYDLLSELGDVIGQAQALDRMSSLCGAQGEHATALSHAERARDLYHAAGYRIGYAQALNTIGWHQTNLRRYAEAVASCEKAIALHRELGDRQGVAHTLDSLGFAYHHLGRYREALAYFREALQMLREAGDSYYETITLTHIGDTLHVAGHPAAASDAWRQALNILGELGHPDVAQVHARLTRLDGL